MRARVKGGGEEGEGGKERSPRGSVSLRNLIGTYAGAYRYLQSYQEGRYDLCYLPKYQAQVVRGPVPPCRYLPQFRCLGTYLSRM